MRKFYKRTTTAFMMFFINTYFPLWCQRETYTCAGKHLQCGKNDKTSLDFNDYKIMMNEFYWRVTVNVLLKVFKLKSHWNDFFYFSLMIQEIFLLIKFSTKRSTLPESSIKFRNFFMNQRKKNVWKRS